MAFTQKKKQLDSLFELLHRKKKISARAKKIVLLVAAVAIVTLLLSALVAIWLSNVYNVRFPSIGTIRTSGVKAYWDADLTNQTKEIQWGLLYPGFEQNITLYLRSISNIQINLEMTTANWTFYNSSNGIVFGPANRTEYMNLTWNYNGSALNPGQVIQTTFTLHMQATEHFVEQIIEKDIQHFSFDINVKAVED